MVAESADTGWYRCHPVLRLTALEHAGCTSEQQDPGFIVAGRDRR